MSFWKPSIRNRSFEVHRVWIFSCFLVPPHPLAQGLPGSAAGWEPDAWEGLVAVCKFAADFRSGCCATSMETSFYYFLNICCAFVYGKNYNPWRNCWLMYRWCQMREKHRLAHSKLSSSPCMTLSFGDDLHSRVCHQDVICPLCTVEL